MLRAPIGATVNSQKQLGSLNCKIIAGAANNILEEPIER